MLRLLSFIFSRNIYIPWSYLIRLIFVLKGVKVGRGFYIEGIPYLKVRGKYSDIQIGNNVKIYGNIDLRNRENGKIIIGDDVEIDNDCRFVAANDATLDFHKRCKIGPYCIFNAGEDIILGEDTIFGGFVHIQSSNHGFKKNQVIWSQKHTYGKVIIGKDVWLGANCTILKGVKIEDGAIIGAKSLVIKNVESNKIVATPLPELIGERK